MENSERGISNPSLIAGPIRNVPRPIERQIETGCAGAEKGVPGYVLKRFLKYKETAQSCLLCQAFREEVWILSRSTPPTAVVAIVNQSERENQIVTLLRRLVSGRPANHNTRQETTISAKRAAREKLRTVAKDTTKKAIKVAKRCRLSPK
jgi:hypothetical protein